MALMLAACGNPSKMAKLADMVETECTPEVLEAVNGKIAANYTVEFPAKYFISCHTGIWECLYCLFINPLYHRFSVNKGQRFPWKAG